MTVKVSSIGLKGLEGYRVQVEVQVSEGKESMVIVGLPDASVKESKERVLSAVHTLDCDVTDQKIVVNLSPSEQKKNGPFFDLAMAIGILKERGELKEKIPEDSVFIGALSLDGTVEKVEGMLPALMAAKSLGFKRVYLPYDPLIPLDMFEGLECIVVRHINDVLQHLPDKNYFHFIHSRKQRNFLHIHLNILRIFVISLVMNKQSRHLKLLLLVNIMS